MSRMAARSQTCNGSPSVRRCQNICGETSTAGNGGVSMRTFAIGNRPLTIRLGRVAIRSVAATTNGIPAELGSPARCAGANRALSIWRRRRWCRRRRLIPARVRRRPDAGPRHRPRWTSGHAADCRCRPASPGGRSTTGSALISAVLVPSGAKARSISPTASCSWRCEQSLART